jgi:hypothetical protein
MGPASIEFIFIKSLSAEFSLDPVPFPYESDSTDDKVFLLGEEQDPSTFNTLLFVFGEEFLVLTFLLF